MPRGAVPEVPVIADAVLLRDGAGDEAGRIAAPSTSPTHDANAQCPPLRRPPREKRV